MLVVGGQKQRQKEKKVKFGGGGAISYALPMVSSSVEAF